MSNPNDSGNLPAQISAGIAGIPAALIPASVKALDRLIGAAVDIPVALLNYQKAKIESRTEAFRTVDGAITRAAASKAEVNEQFSDRALENLVRKSYRQLGNKEAVSAAMIEDLSQPRDEHNQGSASDPSSEGPAIDDDWLNVFERYAEDASTERMQKLWGRVLAGEIRKPGKYGMRTLRFLSEFSQSDALEFSAFCQHTFGGCSPKSLVEANKDIRNLLAMEAAGLIQGATGLGGLQLTLNFNEAGRTFIVEHPLAIMLTGTPGTETEVQIVSLTSLGKELVNLLPGRDARSAARVFGSTIKRPGLTAAFIMLVGQDGSATPMEILWQDTVQPVPVTNNL